MKCYGLLKVPEGDWVCELCAVFGKEGGKQVPCALCPKRGGSLKPTVHLNDGTLYSPNYQIPRTLRSHNLIQVPDSPERVWVHIFCALQFDKITMTDRASKTGINLTEVEHRRFTLRCEVCKTKEGACVQCYFGKCTTAFHPGCAKEFFINTRGGDDKRIYCALHRPLKLRKMLESREKKIVEDLFKFCKAFERWQNRNLTQNRVAKRRRDVKHKLLFTTFSQDEDMALEFKIHKFLKRLHLSQKVPFVIRINHSASTRSSKVCIQRPEMYNLIAPEVILEEKINIDNRSPLECFKRYQDTLYSRIRNEMGLSGRRISVYPGRNPSSFPALIHKHNTRSKELKLAKKVAKLLSSANYTIPRRKRQKRESSLGVGLPVEPQMSDELYCICNKPYYYYIPHPPNMSQEEYDQIVYDNNMIECTGCNKWFHLACMNYKGTLEEAENDKIWKCPNCQPRKKAKKHVKKKPGILGEKYIDKKAIMGELKKGVMTRRQLEKKH